MLSFLIIFLLFLLKNFVIRYFFLFFCIFSFFNFMWSCYLIFKFHSSVTLTMLLLFFWCWSRSSKSLKILNVKRHVWRSKKLKIFLLAVKYAFFLSVVCFLFFFCSDVFCFILIFDYCWEVCCIMSFTAEIQNQWIFWLLLLLLLFFFFLLQ